MTDTIGVIGAASLPVNPAAAAVSAQQEAAAPIVAPAVQAPPAAAAPPPDLQAVSSALNQHAQDLQTSLRFQVDKLTHQLVISVIDTQNEQVLMQIPGEEALAIAQSLEKLQAQLLDKQA
ncbi:MAG: flagellar protein FlaG [Nevskia sp.]|nr:flagellar protein FlaG [Nevskia sp.]